MQSHKIINDCFSEISTKKIIKNLEKINLEDMLPEKSLLGEGATAYVVKAKWKKMDVAVKLPQDDISDYLYQQLLNEIEIADY